MQQDVLLPATTREVDRDNEKSLRKSIAVSVETAPNPTVQGIVRDGTRVKVKALLYHFHGIDDFDFSTISPEDLPEVQKAAESREYGILPTVYLRRENLPRLVEVLQEYHRLEQANAVPNIAGFAIEGPLLGPQGGIPRAGRWFPSAKEWDVIASLGPLGLRYIVMAPDAMALDERIDAGPTFADLLTSFYEQGLRIAVGHFHREAPERSAVRLREVLEFLHSRYDSSPYLVLTDHLYNDTPRNFTHSWRTPQERVNREVELRRVLDPDWDKTDLRELLGPVPAEMLRSARESLLYPCINFDGYHVDLEICRRTVEYLGVDRLIALTDHTEVATMAQEPLTRSDHNPLWLRDDGAVAAGSSGYEQQRQNILSIGFDDTAVHRMFVDNPVTAVGYRIKKGAA
ncbi:hypothetical protein [Streptomyces sp. MJM8645]|uniref:hypothetical protein n=1 Tax=Streptomyces sp. MJM8645 TaxID=1120523 RepID=UPI0013315DA5|nr:hypothetical protein [Streptomyces sp. MJM8645]